MLIGGQKNWVLSFEANCSVYQMLPFDSLASDAFIALCTTLATVSLIMNLVIILVICFCLPYCWKSLYVAASCFNGCVASCALLYHALTEIPLSRRGTTLNCASKISSAMTLCILLGYIGNLFSITVHKWITAKWPQVLNTIRKNLVFSCFMNFAILIQIIYFVAMLYEPTSSNTETRICLPPFEWNIRFCNSLTATYVVQMTLIGLLLITLTVSRPLKECANINSFDLQIFWLKYFLLAISTLPFIVLTVYHASMKENKLCLIIKDAVQVWTLVATVVLSMTVPSVQVFYDSVLCKGTLHILERCCCLPHLSKHVIEGEPLSKFLPNKDQFILRAGNQPLVALRTSEQSQQTDVIY